MSLRDFVQYQGRKTKNYSIIALLYKIREFYNNDTKSKRNNGCQEKNKTVSKRAGKDREN